MPKKSVFPETSVLKWHHNHSQSPVRSRSYAPHWKWNFTFSVHQNTGKENHYRKYFSLHLSVHCGDFIGQIKKCHIHFKGKASLQILTHRIFIVFVHIVCFARFNHKRRTSWGKLLEFEFVKILACLKHRSRVIVLLILEQGDARYTKSIYALLSRSIVWSQLCYCLVLNH